MIQKIIFKANDQIHCALVTNGTLIVVPPLAQQQVMPEQAGEAYALLHSSGTPIRGFVFWDIGDEGRTPSGQTRPLFMGQALNQFLHTRATRGEGETVGESALIPK